ncbi:molybdopterin-synthase adenylyltransferase MoeB [[Pseudomonas] boreopolis]|uniref:molybdopterin-synthase adenylyltransferase MoeB n=1 Tax=Xanthomonas boreopolis TaxID=86183 RepID=UPI003D9BBC02
MTIRPQDAATRDALDRIDAGTIEELPPAAARERQRQGSLLIDIRDEHERLHGQAEGAIAIANPVLRTEPRRHLPDRDAGIVLICQTGKRSRDTARLLAAQGYSRLASVAGGTDAWMRDGLPLAMPASSAAQRESAERYSRQMRLPQIGAAGQQRLSRARILLVGAGGLGSPAALYLAAAGVGHLRIVDDDVVERSNLHRQVLHTDAGVGVPKVISAAERIQALNPQVQVEGLRERLAPANVERLLQDVDVVVDGSDNFATRYLLNGACAKLGKPLVYAAIQQFEGQVSVFDAGRQRGRAPCYRCMFPDPPPPDLVPDCGTAGVLGVLPGVIGMLQATEAIKLLLDIGQPLVGRLLSFDALSMTFRELALSPDPHCRTCAPGKPGD